MEKKPYMEKLEKPCYNNCFWLFMIGCILGVLIEGSFCELEKSGWESHVVSVYGPFNALYGAGFVIFYIGNYLLRKRNVFVRAFILTIVATVLELICGLMLREFLGMRAWNYTKCYLNYKGLICPKYSMYWLAASFGFSIVFLYISVFLRVFDNRKWHIACVLLSVFMCFDFALTGIAMVRWSERHYGSRKSSGFIKMIDREFPDDWMKERFMEWRFLE